jgi:hypothetical protein
MTRTTLLLVGLLAGGAQIAHGQGVPRAVSGRVFDDTTGCPLASVQIQAVGGTSRTTTNVQGRYRLASVPDGEVIIQAARAGYRTQQSLPMAVSDSSARIDFSLVRANGDSTSRVAYPRKTCQLEPADSR